MKEIYHALKEIGVDVALTLAGLFGGMVFVSKPDNKMSIAQKFLTIASGAVTANYVTPLAGSMLGFKDNALYTVAFLLGFSGFKIIEMLISKYEKNKLK
jgi:hypothetical protein